METQKQIDLNSLEKAIENELTRQGVDCYTTISTTPNTIAIELDSEIVLSYPVKPVSPLPLMVYGSKV